MNEITCPICNRIFKFPVTGNHLLTCPEPNVLSGYHFYISLKSSNKEIYELFFNLNQNISYKFRGNGGIFFINEEMIECNTQIPLDINNLQETLSFIKEVIKYNAFL